jgi:hypothetical protein
MSIIESPSQETLNDIPSRAFTFLMGVAQIQAIGTALAGKGYSSQEQNFAWERLSKLTTIGGPSPLIDKDVRDAIAALDAWDNVNLPIIKASLARNHAKQAEILLKDLTPKDGQESVLVVATLLNRMNALEQSQDKEALAALAVLASRGYTSDERKRLQQLVDLASQMQSTDPVKAQLADEERHQILVELYGWFQEWSTVARKLIKRRDHLIKLGIAKRRQAKEPADDGSGETAAVPATASVTAPAPASVTASASVTAPATAAAGYYPPLADEPSH